MLSRLFIAALWSPAGKGLTYWLLFVMFNCDFVTFSCGMVLDCIDSWSVPSFLLNTLAWLICRQSPISACTNQNWCGLVWSGQVHTCMVDLAWMPWLLILVVRNICSLNDTCNLVFQFNEEGQTLHFNILKLLIIWKKMDPSVIENLQYQKIADTVLLSLFMRTNGKCNNFHALAPALAVFCFPPESKIHAGPECEKISTLNRCMGRRFTNSTRKQR